MSSLTNIFTSLANKIRSKTGSEATMTPYEMVNAIDDVYNEGVAHGQTPTQAKSVTATTSAQTVRPDSGYALSSVTVNPQVHSGTYTPSSRSAALDMGVYNNVRYVNTNSVPNTNSGTYTYPWSGGETVDLGAANTYRYVNAQSVYSAGYNAAKFFSAVNLKVSNYGIGASVSWYGWPGIYYFYGHTKSSGGDASISSVANGTLIANNIIRNDGIFSDIAIIRATAEGNVDVYLKNGGTGYVTVYEIVIG